MRVQKYYYLFNFQILHAFYTRFYKFINTFLSFCFGINS